MKKYWWIWCWSEESMRYVGGAGSCMAVETGHRSGECMLLQLQDLFMERGTHWPVAAHRLSISGLWSNRIPITHKVGAMDNSLFENKCSRCYGIRCPVGQMDAGLSGCIGGMEPWGYWIQSKVSTCWHREDISYYPTGYSVYSILWTSLYCTIFTSQEAKCPFSMVRKIMVKTERRKDNCNILYDASDVCVSSTYRHTDPYHFYSHHGRHEYPGPAVITVSTNCNRNTVLQMISHVNSGQTSCRFTGISCI
jgi:hypothetical protein